MQTAEFIRFLLDSNAPVISLDDAVKVLHKKRAYAKLFLHRCIKKGVLGSVERGIYYVRERSNEYEIASSLIRPSYVSMVSALHYYGLTTQIPRIVYVVSTARHRPIKDVIGYTIVFKRLDRSMLFGYHKEAGGNIFIADPEKAIVDIIYFHDVNDLSDDVLQKPPRVYIDRLAVYAERSGRKYVMMGVAELLGRGYASQAERLKRAALTISRRGAGHA